MSSEKKKTSSVIARDEKERSNFTIFIGEQRYARYFLRFLSLGNTHSYNRDTTFFVSFLFRLYRGKFLGSKYSEISSETVDTAFVRGVSSRRVVIERKMTFPLPNRKREKDGWA